MTKIKSRAVAAFFVLAGMSATISSCDKDDDVVPDIMYNLTGNANGF